ncbi:hypothetical protein K523DRAFT_75573 [Schizophyllum commune Tattone D]|nr:hypothetical protein K523DRAFT_75573 [Schizophyllum commune Tattone D]
MRADRKLQEHACMLYAYVRVVVRVYKCVGVYKCNEERYEAGRVDLGVERIQRPVWSRVCDTGSQVRKVMRAVGYGHETAVRTCP